MNILISRPKEDGELLAQSLESLGVSCFVLPTISIENITINIDICNYSDLIFTSKYAVKSFFSQYSADLLSGVNIYAVGASTASLVRGFGLKCEYPREYNSNSLLKYIMSTKTTNRSFAIIAGVGGNPYLAEELAKVSKCTKLEFYKRNYIGTDKLLESYVEHYQDTTPDIIVTTSVDVFKSLNRIFGKILAPYGSKITVTSPKMLELVKDSGFTDVIELRQVDNKHIYQTVEKIIKGNK